MYTILFKFVVITKSKKYFSTAIRSYNYFLKKNSTGISDDQLVSDFLFFSPIGNYFSK